jgi:hypothetical protein
VFQRLEILLFTGKKLHQLNRETSGKCSKMPLRMWDVVVSHNPLSPVPSYSSATKTPENGEKEPYDPEQADKGDI